MCTPNAKPDIPIDYPRSPILKLTLLFPHFSYISGKILQKRTIGHVSRPCFEIIAMTSLLLMSAERVCNQKHMLHVCRPSVYQRNKKLYSQFPSWLSYATAAARASSPLDAIDLGTLIDCEGRALEKLPRSRAPYCTDLGLVAGDCGE
jgi:hypothetical protein